MALLQVKGVLGAWKPKSVKGGKKRLAPQQQDHGREERKPQPAATQEHGADSSPERAGTRACTAAAAGVRGVHAVLSARHIGQPMGRSIDNSPQNTLARRVQQQTH